MRAQVLPKTRSKPAVAYAHQERARANISAKLQALQVITKLLQTDSTLAAILRSSKLPCSPRAFNEWKTDALPDCVTIEFKAHSNSNEALTNSGLRADARNVVKQLKDTLSSRAPVKLDSAAKLRRELKVASVQRHILELQVVELMRQTERLQSESKNLQRRLNAAYREAQQLQCASSRSKPEDANRKVVSLDPKRPASSRKKL
jgi:hypothetical protein